MEIKVTKDGLKIKKVKPTRSKLLPFTEEELLKKLTPEKAHIELLTDLLINEH